MCELSHEHLTLWICHALWEVIRISRNVLERCHSVSSVNRSFHLRTFWKSFDYRRGRRSYSPQWDPQSVLGCSEHCKDIKIPGIAIVEYVWLACAFVIYLFLFICNLDVFQCEMQERHVLMWFHNDKTISQNFTTFILMVKFKTRILLLLVVLFLSNY